LQPTVYIPNLNGSARLERLLRSLARQTAPANTVVVDNASTDESVAMVRARFPETEVVSLSRNRGFGAALNHGISECPGDPLILLNNDVQCDPAFVEQMLLALKPDVEMVAGVLTQHDSPGLIDSAGVVAARRTLMAFDYLHGEPLSAADAAQAPLAPTGGAALYRRSAFEEVGGFDERMFAYYEDLDLALRLRAAGARCGLAPGATGRHLYSATLGGRIGDKYALTGWSRGYMLRRYAVLKTPSGAVQTLICEAGVCGGQVLLDHTIRGILGRFRGWRAAAGLSQRAVPDSGLIDIGARAGLSRRMRRRRAGPLPRAETGNEPHQ
jgi:GT2 family glycosyltransferase